MNITEVPLQWVAAVNCIRSGSMKYQIDRPNSLVQAVGDGKSGPCDRDARIGPGSAAAGNANRVENEGSGGAENSLRFSNAGLHGGAIPQRDWGTGGAPCRQIDERVDRSTRDAKGVCGGDDP